jgi:hypothetical protein
MLEFHLAMTLLHSKFCRSEFACISPQHTIFLAMVISISPADWLHLGLEVTGFNSIRQACRDEMKVERFRAHFGASPETCSAIFVDLQTTHIATARIAKPDVLYLLMAINWLKTYQTESQMAGTFKVDEKTVRTHIWKYVRAIQALKGQKVRAN